MPDSLPDNDTPASLTYGLQILQSLRKINRAIDVHSRKLKSDYNITGPQLVCLGIIQNSGSSTVTRIAKEAYLSASTVVGILDRLEQEGYIVRQRDPADRRNWNVELTKKASTLLESVPALLHDGLLQSIKQLPESEQASIANSILKIVQLLGAESLKASPMLATATVGSRKV
ncbi:MAG: MarR family transcriptional regulator [Candidatus Marinimicrobia bacterium]|nr:MarR family transcriptional regulator [Candidatus Neomarinimicrobiota bacterium]